MGGCRPPRASAPPLQKESERLNLFLGGHPPNPPKRRTTETNDLQISNAATISLRASLRSPTLRAKKNEEGVMAAVLGGGKKKALVGADVSQLKQCGLYWFFGSRWGRAVPMMKGVVGLPDPSFAVCKSEDAVKQTVFAFHKSEPRTKKFECLDAFAFVLVANAESD